jgi:hypothetical protein
LENNLSSEATVTGINLKAKQSSSDEGTNKSFAISSNIKSSQLTSHEYKTNFRKVRLIETNLCMQFKKFTADFA